MPPAVVAVREPVAEAEMAEDPDKSAENRMATSLPLGIGIGIALGAGIGIALDNLAMGIAIGVAIGVGLGGAFAAAGSKRNGG
jgi:hypothetical protein